MDDMLEGTRNKRGDWAPKEPAKHAPLFAFPPRPLAILKWLPHYFFPYNVPAALSAVAWWYWVIPDVETMKNPEFGWIAWLYLVNAVAVFLWFGIFELRLYILRWQGNRYKYDAKWPSEHPNPAFFFKSQNLDSLIWTFCSAIPIWTGLQVVFLYLFSNGYVPWLTFADNPIYLFCLCLLVPIIHEISFFSVHRLLHVPFLYKWVHSVHHNSVNPSPFSSLAMHPVEHLLYLGICMWHLILPSNPMIALYQLHFAGFLAIPGHVGFEKIELSRKSDKFISSHAYVHHLHHKYFEVNYGDGLMPLDKWFGTFHDGSPEGQALMQERFQKKKARLAAKAGGAK
jgi:sterol desaturase/sphingolipid hydroxylase (fatty acid hydroxylase superfamily)